MIVFIRGESGDRKPIKASAATGETSNGTLGENELEEMLEPLDFRADEFVSAMDKLLLGMESWLKPLEYYLILCVLMM